MDLTGLPGSDLVFLLRDTSGDSVIDTYDPVAGTAAYGWSTLPSPDSPVGITDGPAGLLNVLGLGSPGAAGFTEVDPGTGTVILSHAFMDFAGSNIRLTNLALDPLAAVEDRPPRGAAILHRAAPNPFNGLVEISYELPHQARIVEVFDLQGRAVRELPQMRLEEGRFVARWDGRDASGREVPSGTYMYRIHSDAGWAGGKVQLVK